MRVVKNIAIKGKHLKPIITDLFYLENNQPKKIVIFCHGYKGYKDWGAWNLVAEEFAKQNIFFIKINFSHNGGTLKQPIDFPDLEAFGNNNFIKELDDLETVINWVFEKKSIQNEINLQNISLIGHSRGGGIVLLKANEDKRIKKVITWAGISDFGSRFPTGNDLKKWKDDGVTYITNARTKQKMPHYIQFYTVFEENKKRLHIKSAVKKLNIPHLIVHGSKDETVLLQEAKVIDSWNTKSALYIIKDTNHTFDSKHPWENKNLPDKLKTAVNQTIHFITPH